MESWAYRLGRGTRGAMSRAKRRPRTLGACTLAAVAVCLGLWSCQTTPAVRRGALADVPSEPEVRVRIKGNATTVKLAGPPELVVRQGTGASLVLPTPVTVEALSGGVRLTDGGGQIRSLTGTIPVEVSANHEGSAAAPARIKVDGTAYAGRLRVLPKAGGGDTAARPEGQGGVLPGGVPAVAAAQVPGPDILLISRQPAAKKAGAKAPAGRSAQPKAAPAESPDPTAPKMDIIEIVPLETYLVGVVASELPKQWPVGAFEVQAVCARTYALHERERSVKAGKPFDLIAGELDQAYNGYTELPAAVKGVADTRGVVVTFKGRLLRTYYSSTCGGRTAGAATVWPTGPGFEFNLDAPIQSSHREHACQDSPVYRWTLTRERGELTKRLKGWGANNGNPIGKMTGQVASLAVETTNEDQRPVRYIVTDDRGAEFPLSAELLRVACNYAPPGVAAVTRETRVRSGDMEWEVQPGSMAGGGGQVVIRGRGFGHGVGMCQYCTRAMAARGDAWQAMVLRFYPGAKVERAY
jgi:SpoIID/LytB domain protein